MKVERKAGQRARAPRAVPAVLLLTATGLFGALELACSSSSDSGPASAGASNGGSTSASGGATTGGSPSGGSVSSGGSSGQAVDCVAVCGHVKSLCSENNAISDVWIDACKSACDARVQLTPAVAALEQACVMAAPDCNAAVICVASPH